MLHQAGASNDPSCRILLDNVTTVSEEATATIGSGRNMKRAISQRHAIEHDNHPPLQRNAADIVLTPRMSQTTMGETSSSTTQVLETPTASSSLGHGTVSCGSVTTTTGMEMGCSRWPRQYSCRFTQSMPLSAVLLCPACMPCCNPKMRAHTFVCGNTLQRLHGFVLDPATILMDFESAGKNPIQRQFPNVSITGCFFHLNQSMSCGTTSARKDKGHCTWE